MRPEDLQVGQVYYNENGTVRKVTNLFANGLMTYVRQYEGEWMDVPVLSHQDVFAKWAKGIVGGDDHASL
jgi:hypothetical protein